MRKYLYIIVLVLLCTGCHKKKVEMDLDMYNSEQVSLMVKGKKVFSYDEGDGQLGRGPLPLADLFFRELDRRFFSRFSLLLAFHLHPFVPTCA